MSSAPQIEIIRTAEALRERIAAWRKAGETIVPGYLHFEYVFTNDDGEEITEDLLLSKRVQVEGKHVKYAAPDGSQKGVVNIRLTGDGGDTYTCDSLIICTGAQAKWLGMETEEKFKGFGSQVANCGMSSPRVVVSDVVGYFLLGDALIRVRFHLKFRL